MGHPRLTTQIKRLNGTATEALFASCMIGPMAESKVEVVFAEKDGSPKGYRVLGTFSVVGSMPTLMLPDIGASASVDLQDKRFIGQVLTKLIEYSDTDISGKVYDFVTRIIITLIDVHDLPEPEKARQTA